MQAVLSAGRSRRRRGVRTGFTLVELIVAMLLLTIGLLGLAGVGGVVLKQMNGGSAQTVATSIAQSRFEELEGDPCVAIVGGSGTVRGMSEKWTVGALGLRAKTVYDTVTVITKADTSKIGIHTVVSCVP